MALYGQVIDKFWFHLSKWNKNAEIGKFQAWPFCMLISGVEWVVKKLKATSSVGVARRTTNTWQLWACVATAPMVPVLTLPVLSAGSRRRMHYEIVASRAITDQWMKLRNTSQKEGLDSRGSQSENRSRIELSRIETESMILVVPPLEEELPQNRRRIDSRIDVFDQPSQLILMKQITKTESTLESAPESKAESGRSQLEAILI
ncbi:hypothetical protein DFH07DRAFT_765771 [Mycena maculata]|uniref:Uncharacterized protein n=1 Tax=Mycena maculata TaxID=230809 RepID=A0AAD7K965_9AGAR|nr:hypothetical protein DFH07DRAFT_765771 [Mycena maculata]